LKFYHITLVQVSYFWTHFHLLFNSWNSDLNHQMKYLSETYAIRYKTFFNHRSNIFKEKTKSKSHKKTKFDNWDGTTRRSTSCFVPHGTCCMLCVWNGHLPRGTRACRCVALKLTWCPKWGPRWILVARDGQNSKTTFFFEIEKPINWFDLSKNSI